MVILIQNRDRNIKNNENIFSVIYCYLLQYLLIDIDINFVTILQAKRPGCNIFQKNCYELTMPMLFGLTGGHLVDRLIILRKVNFYLSF